MIGKDGIILFDKSFLQLLNPREAEVLNQHKTFVCSQLQDEILGNLAKKDESGKGRDFFTELASKLPQDARYTYDSFTLCALNLLGHNINLIGKIPELNLTELVQYDPKIIFKYICEQRLQKNVDQQVIEISMQRKKIIEIMMPEYFRLYLLPELTKADYSPKTCKDLSQAKAMAESYLLETKPEVLLEQIFKILQVEQVPFFENKGNEISNLWKDKIYKEMKEIAPYAAFVLNVEIFFQIALNAGESLKIEGNSLSDIRYLHYLPFCKYFVSHDKLHIRCASIFMREDQEFILGSNFKNMLKSVI